MITKKKNISDKLLYKYFIIDNRKYTKYNLV